MPSQPYLQSVELQNFRGVRSLRIDPLRRITLFGGLNGSGKTTILDAVFQFMDSGNPGSIMRSSIFRQTILSLVGIHRINESGKEDEPGRHSFQTRDGYYEIVWQWGMQKMDASEAKPISMTHQTDSQTFANQLGYHLTLSKNRELVSSRHYTGDMAQTMVMKTDMSENLSFPPATYLNRFTIFSANDIAARYSLVVQSGLKKRFLEVLNSLSWQFEDVEILQVNDQPALHLSINDTVIPLTFAGDGIATLAAVSLSLMNSRGGIVILDEFDASIHYSKMAEVWKIFYDLAREFDVQIIAATHSRECASALFNAVSSSGKNDAIYYRLDLVEGKNIATSYSWDEMRTADVEGWEYR